MTDDLPDFETVQAEAAEIGITIKPSVWDGTDRLYVLFAYGEDKRRGRLKRRFKDQTERAWEPTDLVNNTPPGWSIDRACWDRLVEWVRVEQKHAKKVADTRAAAADLLAQYADAVAPFKVDGNRLEAPTVWHLRAAGQEYLTHTASRSALVAERPEDVEPLVDAARAALRGGANRDRRRVLRENVKRLARYQARIRGLRAELERCEDMANELQGLIDENIAAEAETAPTKLPKLKTPD